MAAWSFYAHALVLLAVVTLAFGWFQSRQQAATADSTGSQRRPGPSGEDRDLAQYEQDELRRFKLNYLVIYGVVMASDWLQGPYLYSLYKDEFGISLHMIAILFVMGFLSAGLTAPYVGTLADKYGRKLLCLAFCATYALSCVTKMFNSIALLSFGRLLGGISTSILFSVFESWMVSTAKHKGMPNSELGALLGRCTLVNGLVASASGLVSDGVVSFTGTYKAPFVASGLLLLLAGAAIRKTWSENYGSSDDQSAGEQRPLARAWKVITNNPSLIALGVVMTCYETTMYLFVFIWVVALQDTQDVTEMTLPLGTIFSVYMVAMMLGSMIYTIVLQTNTANELASPATRRQSLSPEDDNMSEAAVDDKATLLSMPDSSQGLFSPSSTPNILFHGQFATVVLLIAAIALAGAAASTSTHRRFIFFVLFEGTVGLYYPVLGALRASMIPEEVRASVSALFRVPLNLLVTLALVTGAEEHRLFVLRGGCTLLMLGAFCSTLVIVKRAC